MGEKIDGRQIAAAIRDEIKNYTSEKAAKGLRVPCLATILVGDDGGSKYYLNNQNKLCSELGLTAKNIILDSKVSENEVIGIIDKLNLDSTVDGIMIQLPLPEHLSEENITSRISCDKDVDGLTFVNTGKLYKGEECFIPCTPLSIISLIKSTVSDITGKHAVILGRSTIVGKPVAQLLLNENATVTICHSKTQNLKEICRLADILVCAIGKPGFVTEEYIKEGAIVIDVGTSSVNGKITGDVTYEAVLPKAAHITPVPGGVGAMTTTMLISNTCKAHKMNVR